MAKRFLLYGLVLLSIITFPRAAFSHGVEIKHQTKSVIEIKATYDTGEPVSQGQVIIYAPGDPSTPWARGKCDDGGRYTFTPDFSQPGTWVVQVRKAGHGGMVHIPVGENMAAAGSSGYTTGQIALMSACVVWGLFGTALFFTRRKR